MALKRKTALCRAYNVARCVLRRTQAVTGKIGKWFFSPLGLSRIHFASGSASFTGTSELPSTENWLSVAGFFSLDWPVAGLPSAIFFICPPVCRPRQRRQVQQKDLSGGLVLPVIDLMAMGISTPFICPRLASKVLNSDFFHRLHADVCSLIRATLAESRRWQTSCAQCLRFFRRDFLPFCR